MSYKYVKSIEEGDLSFWKRYYYDYLNSFLDFLIPKNSKDNEYIVIPDELGHTNDVQSFLEKARNNLTNDGRIVITQYSALWEPILRIATFFRLRDRLIEQNWLSLQDLKNFVYLSGLEVVKSGTKMLMPVYIPFVSWFMNIILVNIWPFNHLGLLHYVVARKPELRIDQKPSISVIVPARNEAGTIERIAKELPNLGLFTEIIFIEGNSTDNTYEEIKRVANLFGRTKKIKYAKQEGRGKGDAVRKGFEIATGDILAIYDADMTVLPEDMEKFYKAVVWNKGDFINGSRLVYPLEKDSMRLLNMFANKFFGLVFSWILNQPIKDTLCGTKVLWKRDYEKIKDSRAFFGDFDPFGDFDLLFGAAKLNLKIIDLPVRYKERVYGATNISRWKHGWLLLKMTLFAMKKMKFV